MYMLKETHDATIAPTAPKKNTPCLAGPSNELNRPYSLLIADFHTLNTCYSELSRRSNLCSSRAHYKCLQWKVLF